MEPTLQGTGASSLISQDRRAEKTPGTITLDHVLVDYLSYRFTELKRGNFLAFKTGNIDTIARRHPPGAGYQVWVKRLISLPGEFVEFKDGAVFADGVRFAEGGGITSIHYSKESRFRFSQREVIPEGQFFVLGDNPSASEDGRGWCGVPAENVIGKFTTACYPFSRARTPGYSATFQANQ